MVNSEMGNRLPPHDIDAEEAVIGSLLIDGAAIYKIATFLQPLDFYSEQTRWLYEACLPLYERNEAINQITVAQELARQDKLETCGGAAYLSHLISICPTSLDLEHYAQIISRLSVNRRLISAADQIAALGYKSDPDIAGTLKKANELILGLRKEGQSHPLIPKFSDKGNRYLFEWEAYQVAIEVSKLQYHKDGRLTCNLLVTTSSPNYNHHLLQTNFNLTSNRSRSELRKELSQRYKLANWDEVLETLCLQTIEQFEAGEPAEEIWPSEDDDLAPSYLLEPILYLNHPTVIFGDYSSLKSLVALATAYVVQPPYFNNELGLTTTEKSTLCLYADYEDDPSSFRKRWSALERGFSQGEMPIFYRRMTGSLSDSVEQLQRIISDKHIGLIIVDSLGPAARGNLNDPEPAIKYHTALRQLGITSLTLAHTSKDQFTTKRTIFGSVFFTNLARSVWECKSEQETGEDEAVISLKHTKANLSRLHPPLGYRFTFGDNNITVAKTDLRDTGLSGELPLSLRIKDLLRGGAMTVKEIAEQLGSGEDTTGRTLRRMRTKNKVVKLEDDTWGLCLL